MDIRVFTTRQEIYQLTGITPNQYDKALWDVGFNLDDWDFGICMSEPMTEPVQEVIHYRGGPISYTLVKDGVSQWVHSYVQPIDQIEVHQQLIQDAPEWMQKLYNSWMDYCVGGSYTEYQGKHYYLWHHA